MEILPAEVIQEIDRLRSIPDETGRLPDDSILPVLAALSCAGFKIRKSYGGSTQLKKSPWVEIESPEAPELLKKMQDGAHSGPEFAENRKQLWQANHKEAVRLYDLLAEFYTVRPLVYPSMLIVEKRGPGYGRLTTQSATYAHDLNEEEYAKWLKNTQAELDAFADFLIAKL